MKFSCTPCEPMVLENFPFDKYEMEASPLTQYILERRQANVAWQVQVEEMIMNLGYMAMQLFPSWGNFGGFIMHNYL